MVEIVLVIGFLIVRFLENRRIRGDVNFFLYVRLGFLIHVAEIKCILVSIANAWCERRIAALSCGIYRRRRRNLRDEVFERYLAALLVICSLVLN